MLLTIYVIAGVFFLAACIGEFSEDSDRPTESSSSKEADKRNDRRRQKLKNKS